LTASTHNQAMDRTPRAPHVSLSTIGLVLTLLLFGLHAAAAVPARPNILWLVSEDNTANYVGAYGDQLARTPNLDQLARTGVTFDRAYSTSAVCAPTRASIITGMYSSSLGTQHMRSRVPLPGGLRYFPAYLRETGYFTSNNAKTDYNAAIPPGTWDESNNRAHWRHRAPGQPFFAVFNFAESHEGRLHERRVLRTDPAKVRVPAYLPDTPEVRADLAQYYDCVADVDQSIGRVLADLESDGLSEDTIVFYYSDHGGATPRSKCFLYENGTRPALMTRFPPKFAALAPGLPGTRCEELVNFIDLAPTVLSLAGIPIPVTFQGRAFTGRARRPPPEFTFMLRDRNDENGDFIRAATDGRWRYIRNYVPHLPAGQHNSYFWKQSSYREWEALYRGGKLSAIQRAFFEPRAPEELYDCLTDPDNVHNLASDPAHAATLARCRSAQRTHLLRIRDTGFMPEAMLRAMSGDRSPVEICRSDANYPLGRLIELVDRLQLESRPRNDDLLRALADPLAVLRYWGAIGALRAAGHDMSAHLADPDVSVRLAAAFGVARGDKPDAAWPVFAAALAADESPEVRLESLNHLTNLSHRPGFLRPALEAAAKSTAPADNYCARAAAFLLTQ
jgi:N-sulfoglucosamine sulfohydrolase